MSDTKKESLANPLPSQGELQSDHADDEIDAPPLMETSSEDEEDDPGKLQSEDTDDEISGMKAKEHPAITKSKHKPRHKPADRADPLCDSGAKVKKKDITETPPMAQQESSRDDKVDSFRNKGELEPAHSAKYDVVRSKAKEHKSQMQVAQRWLTSSEDLTVSKTLEDEQITTVAENSEENPQVALIVKIPLMMAILLIILFVFYFGYSLSKLGSNDATLEDKILSGNKIDSLKMLKESTVQNYNTIYMIVIWILLIILFGGFGLVIFYKDMLKHHSNSKWDVVRTALRAVGIKQIAIRRLQGDLKSESSQREKLLKDIHEYSEELKKAKIKDTENLNRINELEEQKKEKEKELSEAKAHLEYKDRCLGEAEKREQKRNKDLEAKEAGNQELKQKANKASKVEDDCDSILRNRSSTQQTMKKKDKDRCNIQ